MIMKKSTKKQIILFSSLITLCLLTFGLLLSKAHQRDAAVLMPSPSASENNTTTLTPSPIPQETVPFTDITPVAMKTSSDMQIELKASNNWISGNQTFTQLDGILTNTTSSPITNWTLSCTVPNGSKMDQNWSGVYSLSGSTLTVSPVSYNSEIAPNGSINFGCIIASSQVISPKDIQVTYTRNQQKYTGSSDMSTKIAPPVVPLSNAPGASSDTTLETHTLSPQEKAKIAKEGDWLYVKNNKIIDKNGQEVWLTGINWFGYNTGTNTFDGLWSAHLDKSIEAIADRGFNLLRIPMSVELVKSWSKGTYPTANFNQATNSHLAGKNSLEIFDYVLDLCEKNGIKVMIDMHSAKTDAMGHMKNVWYEGDITEADFINALSYLAGRYKTNDTIIAYDLKNEPHGKPNETPKAIWNNSKAANNWKYIAEKAAKAILKQNPNVLIMVEGIEIYPKDIKKNSSYASTNSADYYFNWWGGNLRGVKDYPIQLGEYQNKLVYSPHDYGPAVYQQPWFKEGYTYNSLYKECWRDNWLYIYEDNIAPLLIGEWGGYMTEPNLTWMTHLRSLIIKYKLHHTFWCFNANSGDTGGLVKDDFTTWDEEKYAFVKKALWQINGKFVGLDQDVPLGKNGISLKEYAKR